jgi:N-acetylmuramoyl-L-alanine amidase
MVMRFKKMEFLKLNLLNSWWLIPCWFILLAKTLYGVDFHDFDIYQNKLTKDEIESKIEKYLKKDPNIKNYYEIKAKALYIGDLSHQQIDYVLNLSDSSFPVYKKKKPKNLKKAKIAIDPGHFGGTFAELEERFVSIPAEKNKTSESINFNEGTLTYKTAILLKSLLEEEGAEVMLTRSEIGRGALNESFLEWLQKNPPLWKSSDSLSQLFRKYYNREDLYARAQKINSFDPDITIIIHYNAHLSDFEKNQKALLTKTNYNLVFIPGAFFCDELNSSDIRYEFLRMIVTDDLKESFQLAEFVANQFDEKLKIPLLNDEKTSCQTRSIFLQKGIYSRNLVLTRQIHSPVCYGETLIQNNEDEIYRLSANDFHIANQRYPKRLLEVAQAYFIGIKSYFENSHGKNTN